MKSEKNKKIIGNLTETDILYDQKRIVLNHYNREKRNLDNDLPVINLITVTASGLIMAICSLFALSTTALASNVFLVLSLTGTGSAIGGGLSLIKNVKYRKEKLKHYEKELKTFDNVFKIQNKSKIQKTTQKSNLLSQKDFKILELDVNQQEALNEISDFKKATTAYVIDKSIRKSLKLLAVSIILMLSAMYILNVLTIPTLMFLIGSSLYSLIDFIKNYKEEMKTIPFKLIEYFTIDEIENINTKLNKNNLTRDLNFIINNKEKFQKLEAKERFISDLILFTDKDKVITSSDVENSKFAETKYSNLFNTDETILNEDIMKKSKSK